MKARPILFSGPMVRALLAGTKTQTRRIVKPQPTDFGPEYGVSVKDGSATHSYFWGKGYPVNDRFVKECCPYGVHGDQLWCKEGLVRGPIGSRATRYEADGEPVFNHGSPHDWTWKRPALTARFCPRWASRITLEITEVRVQRLQEISGHDVLAEGVDNGASNGAMGQRWETMQRMAFQKVWESINGAGSWSENPFVWALTFRKVMP